MTNPAPTKKTIDAWYDRIAPGDRLTCIDNQVWANKARAEELLIGQTFEYLSGRTSIRLTRLLDGEAVHISRPRRVGDVVSVSDTEITYKVRDDKTCTWRYNGPAR